LWAEGILIPNLHKALLVSGYIMKTLKFITTFLLIAVYSCGQNPANRKVDPSVTILSNKITPLIIHLDNPDSSKQAVLYLDSATTIDKNCFQCYYNKLMFLYSLKQYNKATETINECIRIRPNAHDLYLTGGILYEKVGDTISSRKYFKKSLTILNPVLDTMNVNDLNYEMLSTNKAINLIMLDDHKAGNDLLKLISESQQEPELKGLTLSLMNKSKKEWINRMIGDENSR
jgi:tetratricopeptide (TPR) repeat protein